MSDSDVDPTAPPASSNGAPTDVVRFNWTALYEALGASVFAALLAVIALWQAPLPDDDSETLTPLRSFARWLVAPREENSFLGRPTVNADLKGVWFVSDGSRGWSVGNDGVILATNDGGSSWQPQESTTDFNLRGVTFADDGRRGWAYGDRGAIVATVDGGLTWTTQTSGIYQHLSSLVFARDGLHGWTVGLRGTILATTDGGKTWLLQTSGTDATLGGIAFADDMQRGWIVGAGGTVLSTSDGGYTWLAQSSQGSANLWHVTFTGDGVRGWIAGDEGTIFSTSDDGLTWRRQASGTREDLLSATFVDAQRGWAVGDMGTIIATADGGETWEERSSGLPQNLWGMARDGAGVNLWVVGTAGSILTTADGGVRWRPQSSGTSPSFADVAFEPSGVRGYAVGLNGETVATTDGGRIWRRRNSDTSQDLYSVALSANGQRGWAVGPSGTIVATPDAGITWQQQTSGTSLDLLGVATADGIHAWAVGQRGTIVTTSDGGATWRNQESGNPQRLYSVVAIDATRVWVVGQIGTILSTTDGGATWRTHPRPTQLDLLSVAFTNGGRQGWAVGLNGTIVTTADAGLTWRLQDSGTDVNLTGIAFSQDGVRGLIAGFGGVILTTVDGGITWRRQSSGSPAFFNGAATVGSNAWVVVGDSTILATKDGGETWSDAAVRRWLPPGYLYLSWAALALFTFVRMWKAVDPVVRQTIGIEAKPDQPAATLSDDRLAFAPLVSGLARVARNPATKLPLVVAINGDWGTGKSSIMRMLDHELARAGVRSAWFNAWHHQDDRVLAVPFLQGVCSESLPRPWTFDHALFRVRLAMRRAYRLPTRATVLVLMLGQGAVRWLPGDNGERVSLFENLGRTPQILHDLAGKNAVAFLDVFLQPQPRPLSLLLAFTGLLLVLNGLRAFPLSPLGLLSLINERLRFGDAIQQSRFRQNFEFYFGDIVWALRPRPVVVFIDDLDRCSPEKAMQVLEATNFLVNAGECLVVLGVAKERVVRLVGLANKEIVGTTPQRGANGEPAESDEDRQLLYARDYLEKLIQLEIAVPSVEPERLKTILLGARAPSLDAAAQWAARIKRTAVALEAAAPLIASTLILGSAVWLSTKVPTTAVVSGSAVQPAPVAQTNNPQPALPSPAPQANGGAATPNTPGDGLVIPPAASVRSTAPFALGAGLFASLFALGALQRRSFKVVDSKTFRAAIESWTETAAAVNPSPRRMRRFGNFTRYVALMLRTEQERSAFDRLEGVLRRWLVPAGERREPVSRESPEWERSVVALASIGFARPDLIDRNDAFAADWRERLSKLFAHESDVSDDPRKVQSLGEVLKALDRETHEGLAWPPPADLVATYRRYVQPRRAFRS